MTYQEDLKKKIASISNQLIGLENRRIELENELNRLRLAEFEEDLHEQNSQTLLKG